MGDSLSGLQGALSSGNLLSTIAHPNIVNPLAAYKDALSTASSVYDLRQKQANEAAGQEFQKSIDPVTGMPNQAALMRGLAGNPTAALAAQQSAQTGQTLDHNTLVTNMARDDAVSGAITGLYGQYGGKVPQQAINDEIDRVAPTVGWNAQQIAQNKAQFGADPVANGQALLRSKILHLQAQQQFLATTPQVGLSRQPQGDVATLTPPITSPNFGQVTPTGSGVVAGMSAKDLGAPFSYNDPASGQSKTTTLGDFLTSKGFRIPGFGGGPAAGTGTGTGTASGAGAGTGPGPSPNRPAVAGGTGDGAATADPMKGIPTGPAPDVEAKWKASTDQFNADNAAAGQFNQRIFPLAQAAHILASGQVVTGQQSDAVNSVKSFLQTMGTTFTGQDMQTQGQAMYDKLGKYLTDYVNRQPFAQTSDSKLASAISGSPSTHISTLANNDVVKAMVGLERMKQAAITDFNNQPNASPRSYSDFLRNWQTTHDPRAFVADMIPDDKLKKMFAGMTSQERIAYANSNKVIGANQSLMNMSPMP